jgi:hypothetical protein
VGGVSGGASEQRGDQVLELSVSRVDLFDAAGETRPVGELS